MFERFRLPKTITVTVTQEDIDTGKRREPTECPIGLALQRRFKRPVIVGPGSIYVTKRGFLRNSTFYVPSPEMTRFIIDYDSRKPVSPSTLTMERWK